MTLQINFSHTFVHKTDFYSELAALQQKDIDLTLKKADVRWSSQKRKQTDPEEIENEATLARAKSNFNLKIFTK